MSEQAKDMMGQQLSRTFIHRHMAEMRCVRPQQTMKAPNIHTVHTLGSMSCKVAS
jgi:hypothetical protein